jgi:hypothetical protein
MVTIIEIYSVKPDAGPDGAVLPGVTIRDCGQKVGLGLGRIVALYHRSSALYRIR